MVNEYRVAISTIDDQWKGPKLAKLTNGNFISIWEASDIDGDALGIAGQLLASNGSPIGSVFQINEEVAGSQRTPYLETLSNGNFIASWHEDAPSGAVEVYFRIFDASGTPITQQIQANQVTDNNQLYIKHTEISGDRIVLGWSSDGSDSNGYGSVARVIDFSGNFLTNEFAINTHTSNNQHEPKFAPLQNGGFVTVWTSHGGLDGNLHGVFGQLFDSSLQKVGSEFQINTHTNSYQSAFQAVTLSNGNFVVIWTSHLQDGSDHGIYAQIYQEDGTAVGGEFRINTVTSGNQTQPNAIATEDGGFYVVWSSDSSSHGGNSWDVFGQKIDSSGNKIGSEEQINTFETSFQRNPGITEAGNGEALVLWSTANHDDGLGGGIAGKFITYSNIPTLTSSAVTSATEDSAYSYTFTATDVDAGDTLTLSGETLPSWLSFNAGTGVLSGTPTNAEVGDHSVVLRASDGSSHVDQEFTIKVSSKTIIGGANSEIIQGSNYSDVIHSKSIDSYMRGND